MKQLENIKAQISKIKNKVVKSKIFNIFFVVLIFALLFLNFFYSQSISPLYEGFVNNDKTVTVSFLQKIKTLPEYPRILEMNNNIYGNSISEEILKQENKKKELISNLEKQLIINPKARDVLYSLYQLHQADGNQIKANNYLMRAKEVDPNL